MTTRRLAPGSSIPADCSRTPIPFGTMGAVRAVPLAQDRAQFGAEVDVVRIQLSVADAAGDFVGGLGPDDFRLEIDGVPRRVLGAYAVDAHDAAAFPALEAVENNELAVTRAEAVPGVSRRHFLVFLDFSTMEQTGLRNARRAALQFVEDRVAPSDMIGFATYSPRRGLSYHVPFTTDHSLTVEALGGLSTGRVSERIEGIGEGIPLREIAEISGEDGGGEELEEMLREMEQSRVESLADNTLAAMGDLSRALAAVEGRKYLLYFSGGLPDMTVEDPGVRRTLVETAADALGSDVVMHTFQPDNLPVSRVHDLGEIQRTSNPAVANAR